MEKITLVGEQPKQKMEPQTVKENHFFGPGPVDIEESIPIEGKVPKGEHWIVTTVVQVRMATPQEIEQNTEPEEEPEETPEETTPE